MWWKWEILCLARDFEPTSLTFQAIVLPLYHVGLLMSPLYPHLPVCAAPCLKSQSSLLRYQFSNHWFDSTRVQTQAFVYHDHNKWSIIKHLCSVKSSRPLKTAEGCSTHFIMSCGWNQNDPITSSFPNTSSLPGRRWGHLTKIWCTVSIH